MALNYPNIILFIIFCISVLSGYYKFLLTTDDGEDKKIKMFKRVLGFLMILGFVQIYTITEEQQVKVFLIVIAAFILNIYTVVHSTKFCNFPRLFVIRLSLYTGALTLFVGGLLWYSSFNSLFGFMVDEDEEISDMVGDTFTSDLVDSVTISESEYSGCPEPDSDDYDTLMNNLHDSDMQQYNNCLEREVRLELESGI